MPTLTLSAEASHLKRSIMRDLLKAATTPGIISLAGGLPADDLLPIDDFRDALNRVITRDGCRVLQYSPQCEPLRDWIAAYMRRRGVNCTRDNIFITNGGQQGLSILSRLFLDPGAPAVIEDTVFTGIQQITSGRGAIIRAVPTSLENGIDLDAFEKALAEQPRPRLAVVIPDFHNPLGVSLAPDARLKLAQIAARYRVPLIEDDPYSPLRFTGDLPTPIKGYDEDGVVFYVGSFSKILAPSVRLGWIVAPDEMMQQIVVMRESIDLESSILIQKAVCEFVSAGSLDAHLTRFNAANRERRDALLGAISDHFSGIARWTTPEGGLFSWLTFDKGIDTLALFDAAQRSGVLYVPGSAFSVSGAHRSAMRFNFSNATPDRLREGIARLAAVVHEHPALPQTA